MSRADTSSTAEAASRFRALQALHLDPPAFDDHFAVHLLPDDERDALRGPAGRAELEARRATFPISGIGIGSLRVAEDEVLDAVGRGVGQYVILGAGFDTFAPRHPELAGRLEVFEVDHPDVQALKRARLAGAPPIALVPHFVPVDFERTTLGPPLRASAFDPGRPAIVSWMNTLPYLTVAAIDATLGELAGVLAPGSALVCNYGCKDVPISEEQLAVVRAMGAGVAARGEPFQSRFAPAAFEALLRSHGFAITLQLTEHDLNARYFADRTDGFAAGVPARVVRAELGGRAG
jgi:methyltransferase (TIGR00027 family)